MCLLTETAVLPVNSQKQQPNGFSLTRCLFACACRLRVTSIWQTLHVRATTTASLRFFSATNICFSRDTASPIFPLLTARSSFWCISAARFRTALPTIISNGPCRQSQSLCCVRCRHCSKKDYLAWLWTHPPLILNSNADPKCALGPSYVNQSKQDNAAPGNALKEKSNAR